MSALRGPKDKWKPAGRDRGRQVRMKYSRQREPHAHKPGERALELCGNKSSSAWLQHHMRREEEVEKAEGIFFKIFSPAL